MAAEIILWISAGLIFYTYLVYPAIAFAASKCIGKKPSEIKEVSLPFVSVLMSVYNEEKVIKKKIESLLVSDYPSDKIELKIGSDASDDKTDEIINEFTVKDNRVTLFRSETRIGKASILNHLASNASGIITIITDANVIPSKDAVRLIASHLSQPGAGLCDATVKPVMTDDYGISSQENLYSIFETLLKRAEGVAWGTMICPYGGFYGVRSDLMPEIPENILADDLFIGISVLKSGFRSFNSEEAIASEDTQPEIAGQFRRRVRIAAGSFQNLFHFGPFPFKGFIPSFCFFSHKVLRWFTPLLLALVFMTTVILSGSSVFYFCLSGALLFFILLTALDLALQSVKISIKPLHYTTQFLMMNIALTYGFMKVLKGIKKGTWEPTKRF